MTTIDVRDRRRVQERLTSLCGVEAAAKRKTTQAAWLTADAAARLAIEVIKVLPGVEVLIDHLNQRREKDGCGFYLRLLQIAELIGGEPESRLAIDIVRTGNATATIVLLRTEAGLAINIEVWGDHGQIASDVAERAQEIGDAMGINVIIVHK